MQVVLIADEQRAQPRLGLGCVEERFAAVEVSLVDRDAEAETRLVGRVGGREVGSEVAVALLDPQRVERRVAHRSRGTRSDEAVPDLDRPLAWHVQLEAELADVGDPLRERRRAADLDRARGPEGKGLAGNVVARHRLEKITGRRPPQPDHRQLVGDVPDRHGCVGLADVQPEPAEVGVDGPGARDDPEALRLETGHRHVADDAAAVVEELRVDDRAGRAVDAVVTDALEQARRTGTGDLDLPERAHVDDAGALAYGRVLGGDEVVIRRT